MLRGADERGGCLVGLMVPSVGVWWQLGPYFWWPVVLVVMMIRVGPSLASTERHVFRHLSLPQSVQLLGGDISPCQALGRKCACHLVRGISRCGQYMLAAAVGASGTSSTSSRRLWCNRCDAQRDISPSLRQRAPSEWNSPSALLL